MGSAPTRRRKAWWAAAALVSALGLGYTFTRGPKPAASGAPAKSGAPPAGASATFEAFGCRPQVAEAKCAQGFCTVPAGCFLYGSSEDEPGRGSKNEERVRVTLSRSFSIQQHELTQGEWSAEGLPNPNGKLPDGSGDCIGPRCPVGNVTWFEALAFANLRSRRAGLEECYALTDCEKEMGQGLQCGSVAGSRASIYECPGYRLPTDAEWEYAARAGTLTAFYSGDITSLPEQGCAFDRHLDDVAWYCFNSASTTHEVGKKRPNAFGLHDMLGNALEWVNDAAHFDSLRQPSEDPGARIDSARLGATRGGLFNARAAGCRSAEKHSVSRASRGPGLGFRLARTLP